MSIQYCRHIKINGERCGSPALRNELFCYYHVEFKRYHPRCDSRRDPGLTVLHPMTLQDGSQRDPLLAEQLPQLNLPELEDRHSIQVALSMVISAVTEARIDPKLAALLFYGLQVASTNAHKLNPIPNRALGKVSLTVLDESNGNLIAPEGDPEDTQDYERKGSMTQYWEMLEAEDQAKNHKAEADAKTLADAVAVAIAEATANFNAAHALPPPL